MKDRAYDLCKTYLSGQWDNITSSEMVFNKISGGLSNQLYYCSLPDTHKPIGDEPRDALLRLYGQTIDGDDYKVTDSLITMLLSERRLGPKLYGVFAGGRLEEYIPSRNMTFHEFKDPVFGRAIARKFAVIHSLDVPINKHPNWLLDTLDLWAQTAIDYHTDPNNSLNIQNPKLETDLYAFDYKSELKWLRQLLTTCGSPPVFSHNDLSETNVLIPDDSTAYADGIVFIDFEWAHYNYRGFDIANYFTKFMFDFSTPEYPRVRCDHNAYPNDYEKRVFIREYIKHSKGLTCDKQTEDQMVKEADYFALSAHLLWALWCLNKCHSSGVQTFGFNTLERLSGYVHNKDYLMATYHTKL